MNAGAVNAALCAASAILLLLLAALCYQRRRPLRSMLQPPARIPLPDSSLPAAGGAQAANPLPRLLQSMSDEQRDQLRRVLQLQQQQCALQQLQLLQVGEEETKAGGPPPPPAAKGARQVEPTSFSLTAAARTDPARANASACHTPNSFVSSMHTAPFEGKHSPPSTTCFSNSNPEQPLPHNPHAARLAPSIVPSGAPRAAGRGGVHIPVVG